MALTVARRIGAIVSLLFVMAAFAQPAAAVGDDVKAFSVDDYHGCAVKNGGSVWCWGDNSYNQLADGTNDQRNTPVRVKQSAGTFLGGVRAISPDGYDHTCAIKKNDTVRCWGENLYGELGDLSNDPADYAVTVKVLDSGATLTRIKALALGQSHSCALKKNGSVWCWGANGDGQLGDGSTDERHGAVRVTSLGNNVKAIGAGYDHTCAVMTDGTVRCWGRNLSGQLGIGVSDSDSHSLPETVKQLGGGNLGGVIAVDGGFAHTCALKSNGTLRCWGWNASGQLGDGFTGPEEHYPVKVLKSSGTLKRVSSFHTGGAHTCALTSGAKAWCWGDNANGAIGQGETVDSVNRATRVMADESTVFTNTKAIGAGDSNTCILRTDLTLWCMGYAEYGQVGYDPSPDSDPAPYIYFPERVDFP